MTDPLEEWMKSLGWYRQDHTILGKLKIRFHKNGFEIPLEEVELMFKELQELRAVYKNEELQDIQENIQYCSSCHVLIRVRNAKYIDEMKELEERRKVRHPEEIQNELRQTYDLLSRSRKGKDKEEKL